MNEDFCEAKDYIEKMLDEAERAAEESDVRLTHEEVFGKYRK
jgi:hypothetical protein